MKILSTGDDHFDKRSPRWDENLGVHEWFADLVEKEKPDLVSDGGDFWERGSTPEERLAVAQHVRRILRVCPFFGTRGNHDVDRDVAILAHLQGSYPVYMVEDAQVIDLPGIAIAGMAWPLVGNTMDDGLAREQLRDVMRLLGRAMEARSGVVKLGVGHWDISGAKVGEAGQPLIGKALTVGTADLGLLGTQLVVASHIHKPQDMFHGEVPILYAGSKIRHDFGEREEKSVLLIEGDHTKLTYTRIPTPARDMIALEADWDADRLAWVWMSTPAEAETLARADVRFRYHVAPEHRVAATAEADRMRARILDAGAASIKLDPVTKVTTRARIPEVATKKTVGDQMGALWDARGDVFNDDERAELLSGLEELRVAVAEQEDAA